MIEQEKAIFIEYCNNCSSHAWCTKHDESRYHFFFITLKQELEKRFEGFTVYGNTNPLTGKSIIPSLGAFEVFYMKCRVFSKIKSSIWPVNNVISSRIKSIIEGKTPAGCETVDYTYDDAPIVEKKRRTINIQKQLKRTFDCQNGSRNDSYACTLTSLPTENQTFQESGLPSKGKPQTWIEMESKIRKRVATPINVDKDNLKKFSQTMYKNKLVTPTSDKKVNHHRKNNENYFLPTSKSRGGNSALKARDPTSLNEMSFTLQTITDFTNVYPTHVDTIIKEEELNPKRRNNQRKLSVTINTRAGTTYKKLQPLDKTEIASTGQGLDTKTDVSFQRKQIRSLSQDMSLGQDIPDQELNTSTVFSQVLKEPSSVKNEVSSVRKPRKALQWFPDALSDRSSPENFEERILKEKKQNSDNNGNEDDNDNDNEEYEIDPVFPNSSKDTTQKEEDSLLSKLKKLRFPDEKLSQLRVSKKTTSKKKITLIPDESSDCRIEVHSTHPQILSCTSSQFLVRKGEAFKIPLKFEYQEIKFLDNFCLFILKNNRAWQKIMLDLTFL